MPVDFVPSTRKIAKEQPRGEPVSLCNVWQTQAGSIRNNYTVEACDEPQKEVVSCAYHLLYAAFIRAFNNHVPLILYPDAIWVQIIQQLAIHVNENAQTLRNKWVRRDDFCQGT